MAKTGDSSSKDLDQQEEDRLQRLADIEADLAQKAIEAALREQEEGK